MTRAEPSVPAAVRLAELLSQASSLPGLLEKRAETHARVVALREKRLGRWREVTWQDYWEQVIGAAAAMRAAGVRPGDRVAIHSQNRVEWLYSDLGAQVLGAIPFGIYPTMPEAQVEYILGHSGAVLLVAEDQEQLDKALAVSDRCPDLRRLVVIEPRGTYGYDDERLTTWQRFCEAGADDRAATAVEFRAGAAGRDVDAPTTIIYTSGTSGPPKAAQLSTRNIFATIVSVADAIDFGESDEVLSYLPLCHALERFNTEWNPLVCGLRCNFAESFDTLAENLAEIQPTIFTGVPRIWQKMQSRIQMESLDAPWFKRTNLRLWMAVGRWIGHRRAAAGGRLDLAGRIVAAIGNVVLFRALKSKLGLVRCRRAITGGAPTSPDTLAFFLGLGIPLGEAYGLTECMGVAYTRGTDFQVGTIGPPLDLTEITFGADGELLLRGPCVFTGYFRDDAATAAAFTDDGRLRTGDIGSLHDGRLRITDRKKDILITAGGKNIAPAEVENALRGSAFIQEAVAVGEGRRYVTALIGIDPEVVGDWAQRRGISFTTYRDLTDRDEVKELIQGEVDTANARLARVEQVKQFRLIPKLLEEEDNEVTATQKVRRATVMGRWAALVEEMYGEPANV